jgi:phosphatidylserine/phosphatidylglycerophosphate/cardiolipin synthase-like enzyme
VLIVDASDDTIAAGTTSAKLLKSLLQRGVRLYSVPGLHAKVYLFDQTAVIGSANLSKHSTNLIEAAVVTDRPEAVASVSYLIESLRTHKRAAKIDAAFVSRALAIPVLKSTKPKSSVRAGNDTDLIVPEPRTWLTGLFALDDDQFPNEQAAIERGTEKVARLLDIEVEDVEWIRYPWSWRFAQEAQPGDNVM